MSYIILSIFIPMVVILVCNILILFKILKKISKRKLLLASSSRNVSNKLVARLEKSKPKNDENTLNISTKVETIFNAKTNEISYSRKSLTLVYHNKVQKTNQFSKSI